MRIISSLFIISLAIIAHLDIKATEFEQISLTIEVTGAQPATGQTILSLFATSDTFLKKPLREIILPVDPNGSTFFTISDLETGVYAVSVVYDADMNGKLNTGLFGIPTEMVGFSNNVKSRFGPPSFKQASFEINHSERIRIQIGSAKGD